MDTTSNGGVDLTGETKFFHGDAVVFADAAGGAIAIQNAGVQVAARPDVRSGENPGLTIVAGNWTFTGGALEDGNIRFSGNGGIAFDSRSLTQRIILDENTTADISSLSGHTLSFNGFDTTGAGENGGVILARPGANVRLTGSGNLVFTNNKTAANGAAINSSGTVNLESGQNTFTNNTAGGNGGSIYANQSAFLNAVNGDILFQGNTHKQGGTTATANAIYMNNSGGNRNLALAAKSGHAIFFYDPVASNNNSPGLVIDINSNATDTGTILFDKYQSDIYGNTSVHNGTLALTGGATYDAADNTGSFTLESGARLNADDAGGTKQNFSTPSLDTFINASTYSLTKTNNDKTITLQQFGGDGLVWNNTADASAHGTFKITTNYTLNTALADNNHTNAYAFGWDGKTLTKTGAGTLTLAAANTYTGGTRLTEGTLNIANDNALGTGSLVMDNATTLGFAGNHSLANAVSLNGDVT